MKNRTMASLSVLMAAALLALMILGVIVISVDYVRHDFPVCLRRQGLEVPQEGTIAYKWAFVQQCAGIAVSFLTLMGVTLGLLLMVVDLAKVRGRSFVLNPAVGLVSLLYGAMLLLISLLSLPRGLSLLACPWAALLVLCRPTWKMGVPILVSWFGVMGVIGGSVEGGFPPILLFGIIILGFTVLHSLWHRSSAPLPPSIAGAFRGAD